MFLIFITTAAIYLKNLVSLILTRFVQSKLYAKTAIMFWQCIRSFMARVKTNPKSQSTGLSVSSLNMFGSEVEGFAIGVVLVDQNGLPVSNAGQSIPTVAVPNTVQIYTANAKVSKFVILYVVTLSAGTTLSVNRFYTGFGQTPPPELWKYRQTAPEAGVSSFVSGTVAQNGSFYIAETLGAETIEFSWSQQNAIDKVFVMFCNELPFLRPDFLRSLSDSRPAALSGDVLAGAVNVKITHLGGAGTATANGLALDSGQSREWSADENAILPQISWTQSVASTIEINVMR